jgi:hypothetical protein
MQYLVGKIVPQDGSLQEVRSLGQQETITASPYKVMSTTKLLRME